MSISPLFSIAGAALAPLARDVVEQLGDGLSFEKLLGRDGRAQAGGTDASLADPHAGFPASPEAALLEAIRRQPLKELEAYVDRLRDRLSAAGIDLSEEIALTLGSRGEIQVDGLHPDRAAVEELLAGDTQLTSTFRQLANALAGRTTSTAGNPISDEFRLAISATDFNLGPAEHA